MAHQLPIFSPLPESEVRAFYRKHTHHDSIRALVAHEPEQLRYHINVALSLEGMWYFQITAAGLKEAGSSVNELKRFAGQDGWIVEAFENEGKLDRVRIIANRGTS